VSQRWLADQIEVAPSGLARYLETGKGLGKPKVKALLNILDVTIDDVFGIPVPETETVAVIDDQPDARALLVGMRRLPSTQTIVFDDAGSRVATLYFLPGTNSHIVFLGREMPDALRTLLDREDDVKIERDEGAEIPEAMARKWKAGRVRNRDVTRLSRGDPLAKVRSPKVLWKFIDETRYPELPPLARLATELHVNNVDPTAALEVVRRDVGLKKVE
jgi:hypothetical protein